MTGNPFRICFIQVNPVVVEYTLRLQKFSNTPRIIMSLQTSGIPKQSLKVQIRRLLNGMYRLNLETFSKWI